MVLQFVCTASRIAAATTIVSHAQSLPCRLSKHRPTAMSIPPSACTSYHGVKPNAATLEGHRSCPYPARGGASRSGAAASVAWSIGPKRPVVGICRCVAWTGRDGSSPRGCVPLCGADHPSAWTRSQCPRGCDVIVPNIPTPVGHAQRVIACILQRSRSQT